MSNLIKKSAIALGLTAILLPSVISADTNDSWEFGASVYGWFPDISGQTSFPNGSGGEFVIPVGDILDNLQFTLQGSFDARKGHWGLFTDVIYMNLGNEDSVIHDGIIGGSDLPYELSADVNFDMKSLIWTTAAYYRVIDQPEKSFDFLAGLRYIDIEQQLDWAFSGDIGQLPLPGREGSAEVGANYWDAIIGVRGRFAFGGNNAWFIPYYLDVGTGDSDITWQAMTGIGYAFGWGEVAVAWRYLSYDLPSDKRIADMEFNGPAAGLVFRW
jgi:hypothetical protein